MIDIESKIISYREDTNDYRLCLTREEIDEIKNVRAEAYNQALDDFCNKLCSNATIADFMKDYFRDVAKQLKEQK